MGPSPMAGQDTVGGDDDSSATEEGSKHETPDVVTTHLEQPAETPARMMLTSLVKQVCRQSCEWAEDQDQMSELCRQVIDTIDHFKPFHVTVEMCLKVQANAMDGLPLMSTSAAADTSPMLPTWQPQQGLQTSPVDPLPRSSHNTKSTVPVHACKYSISRPLQPVHFGRL